MVGTCRQCGRDLPARTERRGRSSEYCSAACRQKAYRERRTAPDSPEELIATVRRQANELRPRPATALESGVRNLVGSVQRLSRLAKTVTPSPVTESAPESVTPDAVTETDEWEFTEQVERHRWELQVHCYRMLGSYDEAEDMVQETFLRAWKSRGTFQGRSSFRAWLYRIATNACLDYLKRNPREPSRYPVPPGAEPVIETEPPTYIPWLQPYPDQLLDTHVVAKETIELVFLVAIQHLPPRQRAVLILRDVLGWTAEETAQLLDTTVASVNSALQRARPTVREHLPRNREDWTAPAEPTDDQRALLERYLEASETMDATAFADFFAEDLRVTMPPNLLWFADRASFVSGMVQAFDPESPAYFGEWRSLPTWANRQPAMAHYVRRPGTTVYRAQVVDVLRIENGLIAEITAFEPHLIGAFGLPMTLPSDE